MKRSTKREDVPEVRHAACTSSHSGFSFSKGYVYTLEVFLAISIIIITLTFLYRTPPQKPQLEVSEMKIEAMHVLEYLDGKGDLRGQAIISNKTAMDSKINDTITTSLDFKTNVCKSACDTSGVPRNKTVVSVDYYIAGSKNVYNATRVKLWVWRRA